MNGWVSNVQGEGRGASDCVKSNIAWSSIEAPFTIVPLLCFF